jgi:transcriptional regulator with XRE-family HTH domain
MNTQLLPASLRARRLELGLSQAEVAKRAGIEQSQVSKLERGLDVRLSTLVRVLTALDLDMELAPRTRPGIVTGGDPNLPMLHVVTERTPSTTSTLLDRFGIPDDSDDDERAHLDRPGNEPPKRKR